MLDAVTSVLLLSLFTCSAIFCGVIWLLSPKYSARNPPIATDTISSTFPCSVAVLASFACVSIPLSPVSIAIDTPARISNTIIVITKAINVIPFSPLFVIFSLFISIFLLCFLYANYIFNFITLSIISKLFFILIIC